MAANQLEGERATSPAILACIDTLDAFARKLYRRARNAGSNFENAATVVRDLHSVLKHLKVEAEDPESLLNGENSAVYMRQLTPITEDTEFTLKQLDTILEKYFDGGSDTSSISAASDRRVLVNDSDKGWTMLDSVELEKIDLLRSKLASQKLNIHMFLDTVQLHNPSKTHQLLDTSSTDLDAIKDKVDAIASRICRRKNSGFSESEDQLWEQFRDALEEEGFAKDVLRKNQDVLRAYIRQVDEQVTAFGGSTPSPLLLPSSDRKTAYEYDPPPGYVPSLPPPPLGGERSSPPIIHASLVSAPALGGHSASPPTISSREPASQQFTRLGPDSQGREIPLDAKWTRIRRSLVSPEVLAREGLRYEARPDFVAILGELKKEDIADLARKSREVRSERQRAVSTASRALTQTKPNGKERRPEDRYHPDKYRNWDVIEGRRDQNGGPGYVINPHDRQRSNSVVSSTGELWDSSDDEASENLHEDRTASSRYPSSYPPPSRPYRQYSSPSSGSSQGTTPANGTDKGTKAYPFIVPPPAGDDKAGGEGREKTSPSATAKPKPILKNKNDDPHVQRHGVVADETGITETETETEIGTGTGTRSEVGT
ncbi:hypothetical protein ONZ43_g5855 [Nemania bipapillata]|uniref:Uncharacterized protein n=1 Tax=Nemania bipapillata TaxID=110536 RepID=A0ACC2I5R9_9PEZI|nr:hypothetical protein ONZ43_g5855 [Nemania bipapillata]